MNIDFSPHHNQTTGLTLKPKKPKDLVLIVHGYAFVLLDFLPLKWRLSACNYKVKVWGYDTTLGRPHSPCQDLENCVTKLLSKAHLGTINFIGYQGGTEIIEMSLNRLSTIIPPWQRGRIVFVDPVANDTKKMTDTTKEILSQINGSGLSLGTIVTQSPNQNIGVTYPVPYKILSGCNYLSLYKKETARCIAKFLKTGKF